MGDSMSDVLQELTGLLDRIAEENHASWKRREEFRLRMEGQRQLRTQMNEFRSGADKSKEAVERRQEDPQFRQQVLETLDQHNQVLETLIARLKDNPKKGPL